jgi:hypothetical protein
VRHGGFLSDDWTDLAVYRYGPHGGGLGAIADLGQDGLPSSNHAAQPLLFAVQYGVLGGHMGLHLLLTVALGALLSVALFALVRELGAPRGLGLALALLAFIYPLSDANRLWAACAWNNLALAAYFAGFALALRGARSGGWWRHAAAAALFLGAILAYELTAAAIALGGALYLSRAPRRPALARWAVDVATAVAGVLLVTALTPRAPLGTTSQKLDHAWTIVKESLSVWADTLWPFGGLGRGAAVAVLLVVLAFGGWRARSDVVARRWMAVAGLGLAFVVVGYAVLVPGEDFYTPLYPGTGNRINLMAGIGMIAVALAIAALIGSAFRRTDVAVALMAVVLGAGYLADVRDDAGDYDRAYRIATRQLSQLKALVPQPPPGTIVYLRQPTPVTAPNVPTFSWRWDLSGATKLLWHDGTVSGYPILSGSRLGCAANRVEPQGNGLEGLGAAYGHAIAVDVDAGRAVGIDSRDECRRAAPSFTPS